MGYMISVAISAMAAFYLAFHTDFGWVFGMGPVGGGDVPKDTAQFCFALNLNL